MVALRIQLVCPAPPGSRQGNRVTATRWARLLRDLGHRVQITAAYDAEDVDLLVALHATKSAVSARKFRQRHPDRPFVLALTGTDLYRDLGRRKATEQSLSLASRIVLLQPNGRTRLPRFARARSRVIYQSVTPPRNAAGSRSRAHFNVCVIGHLRPVKDPFRAALAVRSLPAESRLRVWHLGRALEPRMAARARSEEQRNPRYRWLGERARAATLRRLARSQLMVLSSRAEGGANAIGEAATLGVPILASRIEGTTGLLGSRHPGLFPVGDTGGLRRLLLRAEADRAFYARLLSASRDAAALFRPDAERRAWRALLREL